MSTTNSLSKASLETKVENLNNRVQEGAAVLNQVAVSHSVALASGVLRGRMGFEPTLMGMPVLPTLGFAGATAALLGIGGRKARRTILAASQGLTLPWTAAQGEILGKRTGDK